MDAFLASMIFVVLAEMGDKTQLLGVALATRFNALTVFAGVLVGTLANHFLAVGLGNYLTNVIPLSYIQILAALSFVVFGLWTLRGDQLAGEEKKTYFTPFWTVTIAFFLAEMGDKTQLASIALGAKYHSLFAVWMGTTAGMMISNALGIMVGIVLGKKIPEKAVKLFSAGIFILFGYLGLFQYISDPMIRTVVLITVTGMVLGYIFLLYFRQRGKSPQTRKKPGGTA
ncbi:TMEM165/GDT1 family protein [Candidatus Formimonas warabiya]|uniref:GDT1 family protein n=1 Tax=Formimonas warabiya TaxID=1761012 RepID=A0A3G1KV56_FORW1|nr:TMEM165/GDT1 family protein [Candidatus Formimonas warabiya]ATW26358.1 UPF0016 family membrane protein [Candidatus Formimonas warabiya]